MVVGHAVLEHAARGIANVRAAPVPIEVATWSAAAVDQALAAAIARGDLGAGPGQVIDDGALVGWTG